MKIEETNIINKLDDCIGFNNAKEVLQNIQKYNKVYGKKQYKDYNIIISVKSEYSLHMELIEIIKQMYISLGIISSKSKHLYVNMNNNSNNFLLKDIKTDEEIVVIDMLDYEESNSNIRYKIDIAIKEEPERIYIILENDWKGKISALFVDDFQWNILIDRISTNDKERYIRRILSNNKINSKDEWIESLSKEPYYNVKNTLTNILVEYKLNGKVVLPKSTPKEIKKKEEEGIKQLNELIGMENVKEQILKIVNYLKICKDRKNIPTLHMCFNR